MTPRLSRTTLSGTDLSHAGTAGRTPVRGPAVDPASTTIGIVHLGLGAFHRAHQAVYTEDAAAASIVGPMSTTSQPWAAI